MITLIAAVSDNGVIGNKGALPWRCPEDLKNFRQETLGGAMIMGRKTFQSMQPGAFGDRKAVIVSKTLQHDGGHPYFPKCGSLEEAISYAREEHSRIYLIGGAPIFEQGVHLADRILLTRVKGNYEGDTYLPPLPLAFFREINVLKLSDRATVHEYLRN